MSCTVDNLQKRLRFVPAGKYYFPKLMLGNRRYAVDPLQLGRKCSFMREVPEQVSQGTGCLGLLAQSIFFFF